MNSSISINDFSLLTVIGKGSYAKVILVKKKDNNKIYAMKILKKKYIQKKKQQVHIATEKNVLAQVNHPFIIKMYYSFQNIEKLFFVLEFCPGGQLFGLLSKRSKLSQDQTKFYAAQIVLALQYLHQRDIIYRDLKPQNVLIDAQGYIRLTDFGLSKMHVQNNDAYSICGTPEYLAPQILYKQGHGKPVDWWCLGSIIFQMITGLPPFYSKSRNQLFDKIKFGSPNIPSYVSPKLKAFFEGIFQKKAENRLGSKSIDQIKKHPWFEKINWDNLLKKQIKAPFIPILKSETDVTNFDSQFTVCEVESYTQNSKEMQQCKMYEDFSFNKSLEYSKLKSGSAMDIEEQDPVKTQLYLKQI